MMLKAFLKVCLVVLVFATQDVGFGFLTTLAARLACLL